MKYFFYIFFLLNYSALFSQQNNFTIKGKLENAKCNLITFSEIVQDKNYYETVPLQFSVKNGVLQAKGKIQYPQAFGVYSEKCDGFYGIYILKQGNNNYTFTKSDKRDSFSQADEDFKVILKNFRTEKAKIYKNISDDIKANSNIFPSEKKIPYDRSIKKNEETKDSLIYQYANKNKDSFLVLWYLIFDMENNGNYSNWYKKTFESLSGEVKNSSAGKRLSNKIQSIEKMQPESQFPMEIVKKNYNFKNANKKYIYLDFWFSHCGPCLNDFPKYKEVYAKYKEKGFEIIGVSTDRTKDIADWKKVIKEKDLNWVHFLDENGDESRQFNINAFPTTFLLNSEGIIIKKDISPEELDEFLEQNLK
jgi:thiol-disulfide isomerase/thioredoxin